MSVDIQPTLSPRQRPDQHPGAHRERGSHQHGVIPAPKLWRIPRLSYDVLEGFFDPDGQTPGDDVGRLTDETTPRWDADDFREKAFAEQPGITGYNAHANHFAILSDRGSEDEDGSELLTTSERDSIPSRYFSAQPLKPTPEVIGP